jgi:hypothetical protein
MYLLLKGECGVCHELVPLKKMHLHHIKKARTNRHLRFEPSNVILAHEDKCHTLAEYMGERIKLPSNVFRPDDLELLRKKDPLCHILRREKGDTADTLWIDKL